MPRFEVFLGTFYAPPSSPLLPSLRFSFRAVLPALHARAAHANAQIVDLRHGGRLAAQGLDFALEVLVDLVDRFELGILARGRGGEGSAGGEGQTV